MSSFIWMKGVPTAIADPIPPVNEYDVRPSVQELIEKHSVKIQRVREKLAATSELLYDAGKHDDLWILRFLLSHRQNVRRAVRAAAATLVFRDQHQLDAVDLRYDSENADDDSDGTCEALVRYLAYAADDFAASVVPDVRRGNLVFLRMRALDQHGLVKHVDERDWLPTFVRINEVSFQWCDYVTRTTGRLTKLVRVVDLAGVTLANYNRELTRRDTNAMNAMEDVYPQLLQTMFICNAPAWIQIPWRALRPILPRRLVEKIDILNANSSADRQRLYPYIAPEHLPTRFGGQYAPWPVEYRLPK